MPYGGFGHIVFKGGHCNAHCGHPEHSAEPPWKCHIDRQTTTVHPHAGRVLGLHALWLEKSIGATRAYHASVQFKKILGSAAYYAERKAARGRLKLLPDWNVLETAERLRALGVDGEDSEPEVVR